MIKRLNEQFDGLKPVPRFAAFLILILPGVILAGNPKTFGYFAILGWLWLLLLFIARVTRIQKVV